MLYLCLNDSTSGAYVNASTAASASVSVDFVDVALRDSSNGAFADASTASSARVSDFISHFIIVYRVNNCLQKYIFYCKYQQES